MTAIALEPVEYWKLRALSADLAAAQIGLELAQVRLELARSRRAAHWMPLATQYELQADRAYGAVDDTCSLVDATSA